jgi:hypothetical protein
VAPRIVRADVIQRHRGSNLDENADPVVYDPDPGASAEIDHRSHALRHELVRIRSSPGYVNRYNNGVVDANWIVAVLKNKPTGPPDSLISNSWRKFHLHQSQANDLATFASQTSTAWEAQFWNTISTLTFDGAIDRLDQLAQSPVATAYANQIRQFDYMKGKKPPKLQPSTKEATSGAMWNPDKAGAIFVSMALTDPTEILAAVLFECGNAARADRFKATDLAFNSKISDAEKQKGSTTTSIAQKGKEAHPKLVAEKGIAKAAIELDVDRSNQADMRRAHGAADQRTLCQTLGVPAQLLVPANYVKGQPLPLPDRRVLRNQEARSALWWFMVDTWTSQQQAEIWMATNHNELLGATGSLYA